MKINFTSYANGAIRNADGKLVAFYDALEQALVVDGMIGSIRGIPDIEQAMDAVVVILGAQ